MARRDRRAVGAVAMAGLACTAALTWTSDADAGGSPAYVWLWYADGSAIPDPAPYCGELAPPPVYQCNFGVAGPSLRDCQIEVQRYLDAWYANLNVVFTFTRPPSNKYYPIVITSGWPHCAADAAALTGSSPELEGGIAPGNYCNDNPLQAAIAIQCGKNAHDCAAIIAHEHGHLAGLVHTISTTDLMNATIHGEAAGFEDRDVTVLQDAANACELRTQNSYQRMLATVGPWPGGPKPSPFADGRDAAVADADSDGPGRDAGSSGVPIGPGGPSIDSGPISVIPGYDGVPRPPIATIDGGARPVGGQRGGCSQLGSPAGAEVVLALLGLLVAAFTRARAHRPTADRVRRAVAPPPCVALARPPSGAPARALPRPTRPRGR